MSHGGQVMKSLYYPLVGNLVILLLFLPSISGCGAKIEGRPQYYPVQGKAYLDGKLITEGSIRFHPADSATTGSTVQGDIQQDGTFFLHTQASGGGNKFFGAPQGEYSVSFLPASSSAEASSGFSASQKVTVEPKDNMVTLQFRRR